MKSELAPKHSQLIGTNYVVWFESSNSYSVISIKTYELLCAYIGAKNETEFFSYCHKKYDYSNQQLIQLDLEFSTFLKEINTSISESNIEPSLSGIPKAQLTNTYQFGNSKFTIHYSSIKVRQLINPKIQHATVEETTEKTSIFDIFLEDSFLHLYKNREFIGRFETKNSHFLQGKFSMQLLEILYNTTESDWMATFHASTICNGREAIMLIGDSGNGKSTLSAVLMAHGFDLLADDFTPMLAADQQLYRFPAAISIKKGAFPLMEALYEGFENIPTEISSSKGTPVKYLPPSNSFGMAKKDFACQKIVLVKYSTDSPSELCECPSETLLQTLIPDAWISPNPEHALLFLNWLKNVKFFQLTYSNNDIAVSKFKELFSMS